MAFEIRSAEEGDLDKVLELYKHLHAHDLPVSKTVAKSVYQQILTSPNLHIFLLEESGEARASCYLNIIENLTRGCSPYGLIENVVTHIECRRQGFAKAVLQYALSTAWIAECYKVMLMTGHKELVPFYESCGFVSSAKSALVIKAPAF